MYTINNDMRILFISQSRLFDLKKVKWRRFLDDSQHPRLFILRIQNQKNKTWFVGCHRIVLRYITTHFNDLKRAHGRNLGGNIHYAYFTCRRFELSYSIFRFWRPTSANLYKKKRMSLIGNCVCSEAIEFCAQNVTKSGS